MRCRRPTPIKSVPVTCWLLTDHGCVSPGQVRDGAALAEALAAEAPYDILISSATGGERAIGPFMEMDTAGFQASFDKLCAHQNLWAVH